MKTKAVVKILIGIIVIVGGITYLMVQVIQSSQAYYYSVDDLAAKNDEVKQHSLRLAGKVKPGSVEHNLQEITLNFILAGSKAELPVKYKGAVPDNFTEGGEVVVQGRLTTTGIFQANQVMTKCESKYKAKVNK